MAYGNGQKLLLRLARIVRAAEQTRSYLHFDLQEERLRNFLGNTFADIIVINDRFNNVFDATHSLRIDSMGKYRLAYPHCRTP